MSFEYTRAFLKIRTVYIKKPHKIAESILTRDFFYYDKPLLYYRRQLLGPAQF